MGYVVKKEGKVRGGGGGVVGLGRHRNCLEK